MNKLEIDLKNCYGIKELKCTFKFAEGKKTQIIYAQNGLMKSSFAKTFNNIFQNKGQEDIINKTDGIAIVRVDTEDIIPESIYVINSEAKYFESDNMSKLLVNDKLRKEYENELTDVEKEKEKLLSFLKIKFGYKDSNKVIDIYSKVFEKTKSDFFDLLKKVESDIEKIDSKFCSILYTDLFDDKVKAFLRIDKNKNLLSDYIKIYEELIVKSNYFKKGVFNHNNAEDICKSLKNNKFFEAEHNVILNGCETKFTNIKSMEDEIEKDKDKIFSDPDLKSKFLEIDKAITKNKELVRFRAFIESNPEIILKMQDIESFEKDVLLAYLQETGELYKNFIIVYERASKKINSIIKQAQLEETEWKSVVDIFNDRFDIPIKLEVQNQADVILKSEMRPQIKFIHGDLGGNKKEITKDCLLEILSTGEKRALYILNILFEIEARKKLGKEQLLIIDDIADSFDYRNKYAILEYLQELSEESNQLFLIILTHNFDFYRSLQSRFFGNGRKQSFMAMKNDNGNIVLHGAQYINAFDHFKTKYHADQKIFVATIAFVRNLIECTKGASSVEYEKLTSILHKKQDTDKILIKDVKLIIDNTLNSHNVFSIDDLDEKLPIVEFIQTVADSITKEQTDRINLENKIVLSIAIRILAEENMITTIQKKEPEFISSLECSFNQTYHLYKKFVELFPEKSNQIKILKKVNLITPENIHINSFMYEPILDLGEKSLIDLYSTLKSFNEY